MSHDELLAHYKGAEILVMPSRNVLSSTTISSIKCFEYIASGKPTVVTDSGEHAKWIERFEAGLVVKDNEKDLTKSLDKLLTDKGLYEKLSKNAKKHASDVDYKALKRKFVEEVKL